MARASAGGHPARMRGTKRVEQLADGTVRVDETCLDCAELIEWDHVLIADHGRDLVGSCKCDGRIQRHRLGWGDRPVDAQGKRLK